MARVVVVAEESEITPGEAARGTPRPYGVERVFRFPASVRAPRGRDGDGPLQAGVFRRDRPGSPKTLCQLGEVHQILILRGWLVPLKPVSRSFT